ncbi:MAG: sulfur carrier protein ThiS adenylyltransferase ThiF [Desulfarculus sp.]|nr:MAG: sulfur carrier protein ThiS adenylyltransferase ThiF [Desulfarculus sp.]
MAEAVTILLNEREHRVPPGLTLGQLRDQVLPGAEVLVLNGFPAGPQTVLTAGDRVSLVVKGQAPPAAELEALMIARHTPGVHQRMKAARVGVAGLGGLGSAVAIALARMGVGQLVLADYDLVEPTNLNRQQYMVEHLGLAKTAAMTRILAGVNPYVQVTAHNLVLTPENVEQVFAGCGVVVECLDAAAAKAMFMEAVAASLPEAYFVGASGLAGYGASNAIQTRRLGERIFLVGDLERAAQPGRGLMAPRVGVAAHHQANLVVGLLMDPGHPEL